MLMTGKQFELFLWDVKIELDQKLRLIKNLENYLYRKTVKAVTIGKMLTCYLKKASQVWFLQGKYYLDAIVIPFISF